MLSLLAFGVNLGFALQEANLSTLFKFTGVSDRYLAMIWLIPPLSGLIIQPLVGQMSDNTANPLGKRRPYILFWGLLAALSLFSLTLFNSIMMMIILNLFIDCGLNGSAEAVRALTGDSFITERKRTKAFAMQAILSSIGALVGASLPLIMHHTLFSNNFTTTFGIPLYLQYSFIFAGLILVLCVAFSIQNLTEKKPTKGALPRETSSLQFCLRSFSQLFKNFKNMPKMYRRIFLVHGISWMGIFIFWIYFTISLLEKKYGMIILFDSAYSHNLLQRASIDTSTYFAEYQIVSILYAALLFFMHNLTNRPIQLHSFSLLLGGVALIAFNWFNSDNYLLIEFVGIGIMWGSMIILPYAIILSYVPKDKVGVYIGIFNICITAPQILCGFLLSILFPTFIKSPSQLLLLAGVLIIISSVLWMYLILKPNQETASDLQQIEFTEPRP